MDDLDALAYELATACHRGHAADNLGVIQDLLDVRIATLEQHEHDYLEKAIGAVHEGMGA